MSETTHILTERESAILNRISRFVTEAGGIWIGYQTPLFPEMHSLVQFSNPITGHNLSVKVNPAKWSVKALQCDVMNCLEKDDAASHRRTVAVHVSTLLKFAETLSAASKELNALCARRKQQ